MLLSSVPFAFDLSTKNDARRVMIRPDPEIGGTISNIVVPNAGIDFRRAGIGFGIGDGNTTFPSRFHAIGIMSNK